MKRRIRERDSIETRISAWLLSLSSPVFQYSDAELYSGYLVPIVWPGAPHIYTIPHSNIMVEEALLYRFHGQNTIPRRETS